MQLSRRKFIGLLPIAFTGATLLKIGEVASESACHLEATLHFPARMSQKEAESHLANMHKSEFVEICQKFINDNRLLSVDQHLSETYGQWNYTFKNTAAAYEWGQEIRGQSLVDKSYLNGSFKWTVKINGKVVS